MPELTRAQIAELSAAIIARGFTIDGLAEAADTHPEIVVMIMQGRLRPEHHIRQRLAHALGIDPGVIS
jgi:ribosome-binding protein aMBF1 (putative translation factor)